MMKKFLVSIVATIIVSVTLNAEERQVEVVSDNDADTIVSKIYKLKSAKAADLIPYITHAVDSAIGEKNAQVTSVTAFRYGMDEEDAIVVTMKESMIKDIDDMVQKIDRPGLNGSGLFNFEYNLKNRHNMDFFADFVNILSAKTRISTINGEKIIWKSNKGYGILGMKWLKRLDKLVPRSEVTFNIYEVSEDNVKDIGVDYSSWLYDVQNGGIAPFTHSFSFTDSRNASGEWQESTTNNFQFNASFIRMLQQKGIANLATSGSIMIKNNMAPLPFDPALLALMTPAQQQLYKLLTPSYNAELNLVASSDNNTGTLIESLYDVTEVNIKCAPTLYYDSDFSNLRWEITAQNNDNVHSMVSETKLANGEEKILFSYNRQHDVTQYNGMPFLGKIPYIKYLFGDEIMSKVNSKVFVTVQVKPIQGSNIYGVAEDIITKSAIEEDTASEEK